MSEHMQYRPGSREDFDRLYSDSYPRILFTLLGLLGDRSAAEDCAQETFVRAFRAWPRWRPDAPAEAWLHRIAVHVATSHRRRERLREVGELVRRIGRPAASGEHAGPEARDELIAALRRMPAEQSALIILRHHHGYSNREIARSLGMPESTIASRLAAAKRRLRDEMGPVADAEDGPAVVQAEPGR